jgi:hypothetical protein
MADEPVPLGLHGRVEEIAREYGDLLAEECDLPEHANRFTSLFAAAIHEGLSALAGLDSEGPVTRAPGKPINDTSDR